LSIIRLQYVGPQFQAFFQALAAANNIQQTIDELPSKVNDYSMNELKEKNDLTGDIQFSNVHFSYPTRLNVSILNDLSFEVKSGQTIALVGSSGSGKSTCLQLLQRFYEPNSGKIYLDGKSIHEYNLKWLRQHVGVVSQEPVLFHRTIRENILLGCHTATEEEIHTAAKMANAHAFIMNLPNKYETIVGERGTALSGGQKQRIAIARALIGNPKILLLDEATSALDNESEAVVQDALDHAAQGRTTIVIAHRLSTIRNANKIIVLNKGHVIEEGDHNSLMNIHGIYFNLVQQQTLRQTEEEQLRFEELEATKLILAEQFNSDDLDRRENRSSTITSVTPSVLVRLYSRNSSIDNNDDKHSKVKSNQTLAILRANKPEWLLIVIGCIAAMINGVLDPLSVFIEAKIITIFQQCDQDTQYQEVIRCILSIIGLGIVGLIFQSIQGIMFAYSGGNLTQRLRSKAFSALLRQEIAYFDDTRHSTGVLCARLATEAGAVQGASGVRFGFILQNLVTMGTGIIIGFIFSWQLTLLICAFFPLIFFGTYAHIRLTARFENQNKVYLEETGKIIVETIQNVRTVTQLTKEDYFYDEYSQLLNVIYRSSLTRIQLFGVICSISSATLIFAIASLVSLGSTLVDENAITFESVYIAPDYGQALKAAENIFNLIERKPLIDNKSCNGEEISDLNGQIEFKDVYFVYKNRPESIIQKKFNLCIQPGTSGSGKSTTIQLIERFYDPNVGQVLLDSKDLRSLNLRWYRSQIGIVSQEPILFDLTIRENISYGDNDREDIPLDEIIQGYETICGPKGVQLSGGQKQRIAIARALIRNPKILLLDEATSALDSESEKLVQEALDNALQNRTSITIAHRLSSIKNSDLIYVIHNGTVIEQGTHEELLALCGRYFLLAQGKLQ
ncbi:unnamed protein product, partial [Adineta ricciae]